MFSQSYSNYDARRSAVEAHALAQRQQERRRAEEIALYRHLQRRQAEEEEAELYQQLLAERQREQQTRLRHEERLREREVRDAREWLAQHDPVYRLRHQESLRQRGVDALRQQEIAALRHRRQQQAQAQLDAQRQAQADDSFSQLFSLFHPTPDAVPTPSPAVKIPISAPSPPPTASAPIEPKEDVDTTLEQNYEAHLLRRQKLASLNALTDSFKTHQAVFVLPTSLVFQSPSTASTSSLDETNHRLAFSKINGPFLAYEDFLVGLLSQADAVESGGDSKVKESRRALVLLVEAELKKLDAAKEKSWHEQNIATGSSFSFPLPRHVADLFSFVDIEVEATEPLPVSDEAATESPVAPLPTQGSSPSRLLQLPILIRFSPQKSRNPHPSTLHQSTPTLSLLPTSNCPSPSPSPPQQKLRRQQKIPRQHNRRRKSSMLIRYCDSPRSWKRRSRDWRRWSEQSRKQGRKENFLWSSLSFVAK